MTIHYSSLFASSTFRGTTAGVDSVSTTGYAALTAGIDREGQEIAVDCTYTVLTTNPLAFANSDRLLIAGPFPANCRLHDLDIIPSADMDTDNDLTFNLGWTSAPTTFLSANTGLQATATTSLTVAQASGGAVSAEGDYLELRPAAGELEAAGTIRFRGHVAYPNA